MVKKRRRKPRLTIWSGGQTGVDRAALDFAIENKIAYGGWCPKGGWAEDYPEPPGLLAHYRLEETPRREPAQRTEWNVRDSDATLIVVDRFGMDVSAGTRKARGFARKCGRPIFVAVLGERKLAQAVADWLNEVSPRILSIGGPRASEAPRIYGRTKRLLRSVFAKLADN